MKSKVLHGDCLEVMQSFEDDSIDGNKENNELDNLKTLCVRCHEKKQSN